MPRTRPGHAFALAVTQLTVVPLPVAWPEGSRPDVASWYPVVGLALGTVGWAVAALPALLGAKTLALIASALAVAVLAFLTRGLHWDGLADVADAWYQPTMERRHAVLKDSATGAFGTLAIVLAAIIQVTALAAIASAGATAVVIFAVACGRLAATFSAWLGKPARADGLGASVVRPPSAVGAFVVAFALGVATLVVTFATGLATPLVAVIVVGGFITALVTPHLVASRFGGVTGDTMGASIVITEAVILIVAATVAAL